MADSAARYYSLKTLHHDPELARALGNMVVAWAQAEVILIGTLTRILGSNLNKIQAGYYRIPTFEARIKCIRALIVEWKSPHYDRDAIATAVEKLSKLAGTRNHWIHGDWCASEDSKETVIFDHRAEATSAARRKPVKAADVWNHCRAVLERASTLERLIDFDSLPDSGE